MDLFHIILLAFLAMPCERNNTILLTSIFHVFESVVQKRITSIWGYFPGVSLYSAAPTFKNSGHKDYAI